MVKGDEIVKWVEVSRFINENFPDAHKNQLMFSATELARIFGYNRGGFKEFLNAHGATGYKVGRSVCYCIIEIVDIMNGVRC